MTLTQVKEIFEKLLQYGPKTLLFYIIDEVASWFCLQCNACDPKFAHIYNMKEHLLSRRSCNLFLKLRNLFVKLWNGVSSDWWRFALVEGEKFQVLVTILYFYTDNTLLVRIVSSYPGGGDAQNVDVDLGHFLDVDCRLKGFKKFRIYNKLFEK